MKSDPFAPSAAIRAVDEMLRYLGGPALALERASVRDWLTALFRLAEKFPVELLVEKAVSTGDWCGHLGVDRPETAEIPPRDLN